MSATGSSSPYSKAVTMGETTTVTFVRPTTTVETNTGIPSVCGSSSYSIKSSNAGADFTYNSSWAVITGPSSSGVYTLTINTAVDLTLIDSDTTRTIPVYLKAILNNYTA